MDSAGGKRLIREGIEAAEHWPDFARRSAEARFESIRTIAKSLDTAPPAKMDGANSLDAAAAQLIANAEQSVATVKRGLVERMVDDVRWFGVPVPADITALVEQIERKG